MSLFRQLSRVIVFILLVGFMSGCSSFPPPRMRTPFWQFQQFNNEKPPEDVKSALSAGDEYRRLATTQVDSMALPVRGNVWWYADEGVKFYRHVLDKLEPHNAYAAVCMGQMYLIKSRVAPKGQKMVQLSAAHKCLMEAEDKRKGFVDARRFLGELYSLQGNWGQAEAEFKLLAEAGFADSHIYAWWAYTLKKQKKNLEAIEYLRKAVEYGYPEESANWAKKYL